MSAANNNVNQALSFALQALQLAPGLIGVMAAVINMAAQDRGPTDAERAELDKLLADNHHRIQAAAST